MQNAQLDKSVNPDGFRWALRHGEPGDRLFVEESWRRSYSDCDLTRCPGGVREYIATQKAVIAQALATSEITVAYSEAPERRVDDVRGWVCSRGLVLHYVYVKGLNRECGMGWDLVLYAFGGRIPSVVYTTHGLYRPEREVYAGVKPLVAKLRRAGAAIEYNPALIFGGT